eukprot:2110795-Pleurochrysis_carterae.AAC.1
MVKVRKLERQNQLFELQGKQCSVILGALLLKVQSELGGQKICMYHKNILSLQIGKHNIDSEHARPGDVAAISFVETTANSDSDIYVHNETLLFREFASYRWRNTDGVENLSRTRGLRVRRNL